MFEYFIHADRVFDGRQVLVDHAVGVESGVITRVIPAAEIPAGASIERIDGTLTPGLIDTHVHMTPWMVFGLLAAGVTTVRDLGNDVDTVSAMIADLGDLPLPAIYWSGPLLESDRVNWPTVARGHDTPDEIRATVDDLAARGFHTIKLYYNATPELMAAAADQAHSHGMRVLGHVGRTSMHEAVAAGVDELQHLAGCLAHDLELETWADAARELAAQPVDHCPTLIVWHTMTHLGEPRALRDAALEWVHPQAVEAWANAHHSTQPAAERVRRAKELTERMASIPYLTEAGRGILVGSDAPFPGLVPGFALHDEAGLLVESGMSPHEVMVAMTSGNAHHMGLTEVGVIEAGATADLVGFGGDPTVRIADLSRVIRVWRAGDALDPAALATGARTAFARDADSPVDQLAKLRYIPATATQ